MGRRYIAAPNLDLILSHDLNIAIRLRQGHACCRFPGVAMAFYLRLYGRDRARGTRVRPYAGIRSGHIAST
jgi:hypothetical protein